VRKHRKNSLELNGLALCGGIQRAVLRVEQGWCKKKPFLRRFAATCGAERNAME